MQRKPHPTIRTKALAILTLCFLGVACQPDGPAAPTQLRISEGFEDPLGFYDPTPTFSWQLPEEQDVTNQQAYALELTDGSGTQIWETGKRVGGTSIAVPYTGPDPRSRQRMEWRVRYWDQDDRPSAWSAPARVEYGLLSNDDWRGQWVGGKLPEEMTEHNLPRHEPVELQRTFQLETQPENARLYITAKGVFQASLNGKRIGNDEMTPGYTPYQKRIETLTYDLTDLLQRGENTLNVSLAEGWHSGRIGYTKSIYLNEGAPRLLAQLENAGEVILVSDENWRVRPTTALSYSSIYDGEEVSELREAAAFQPVVVEPLDPAVKLRPKRHAPVRDMETLATKEITQVNPGRTIFDMGQNMVGVPRLRVPLRRGDTLRVRFSEMLQLNGDIYTDNYRSARSEDYYVAGVDGPIDWTPTFTFHGFRYVELSGYPDEATPAKDWVKGVVRHSDFKTAGTFTSSHPKLNQLQHNIEWGLRGNFLDIPTDCPQRDERLGWTGDAQVFAPTSLFLTQTHAFWAAWLQSMREEQLDDGMVPIIIPNLAKNQVSAGWGDAATIIPWELYLRTGDTSVLRENYRMMRDWVGYYESKAEASGLVDFLSFNDWLQPHPESGERRGDTPQEFICTAFFARSADLCGRAARVLGEVEEAREVEQVFESTKAALRNAYFDADGRITEDRATQTAYLLALGFDLLPEDLAQKAVPHLLAEIEAADGHLRTGFLGTPLLAPVLDRYGHSDLAYSLLFKETYPSWFYSINQGATTMWERWNSYTLADGFNPEGMNSFNHYAYGAIGQWMYERIAGIAPRAAGYREISFAPVIHPPLTSAAATHESPYGHIESSWKVTEGTLNWDLTIPPNTTGYVTLPVGFTKLQSITGGNGEAVDVSPSGEDGVFQLTAGRYLVVAE